MSKVAKSVTIDADHDNLIRRLAKKHRRNFSAMINELIHEALKLKQFKIGNNE